MTKKLGRNDLCWCGSGLKYKYCHLKREKQSPVKHSEIISELQKSNKQEYCLHPLASYNTCKGKIIKAHTIQRNNGLNHIARSGHVFMFLPKQAKLFDRTSDEDFLQITLVGIGNASTFTGFCAYHDTKLFEPIEKHAFENTAEHAFLLGYRAISRELYAKRSQISLIPFSKTLDRGRTVDEQIELQETLSLYELGVSSGLRDSEQLKADYDRILLSHDYTLIRYYILRFDTIPEIMVSGAFFPEYDFHAKKLQSLEDVSNAVSNITFSLIATDSGGAAVFCWLHNHVASEQFIRSLHMQSDDQLPDSIIRFAFSCFENMCISPDWWDSLNHSLKKDLKRRIMDGISMDSSVSPNYLIDNDLHFVSWNIVSRHSNFLL